MRDLSVLIAARNERWLNHTIQDVLTHAVADTEVIVILDGQWPVEPIPDHPKVVLVHHATSIGQRAAVNEAARLSQARFVMKLDAHCAVEQGFDAKLIQPYDTGELGPDVTTIPRMYNLHVFDWLCDACGVRTYQGPTPKQCHACKSDTLHRELVWKPRKNRLTDFARFDHTLHFQYWADYGRRPAAQGDLADVLSSVGACFFMPRARFFALDGLDERHGSWGQFGTEIACKSWLSGGRQIVNKRTWFSHLFRTQGGDFGFPYPINDAQVQHARQHSRWLWLDGHWEGTKRPLRWLIDKFAPVPDWDAAMLAKVA